MNEERILAWHFIKADRKTYHGNIPVKEGETLTHEGPLVMCESGLHASVDILDALQYAPGPILCRVELWGDDDHEEDKLVARNRKVLWMKDITRELHEFAIWCAEEALALIDDPDPRPLAAIEAKKRWLRGEAAASYTARDASYAAGAARDAAWAAASYAARNAARAAAGAAARNAAWTAAWNAARNARDAAWAAAWDAAWDAARAGRDAVDKQRKRLLEFAGAENEDN